MIGELIGGGMKLLGGILGDKSQEKMAAQNIAHQREFAQSGIQWKVADAKKAGIHPLYALGASTHSFAPVSVGTPLADAVGSMGQDIGRAVNAVLPKEDRQTAFQKSVEALSLEKLGLENQLLASKIRTINQAGSPPPMPSVGISEEKPSDRPQLYRGGEIIPTDPYTSNAEDFQKRYGDEGPTSWLNSVLVQIADWQHQAKLRRDKLERSIRDGSIWRNAKSLHQWQREGGR